MTYGPMQLVVIGFGDAALPLGLVNQLRGSRDAGCVRLVDALFVAKDEHGGLTGIEATDVGEVETGLFGTLVDALFGYTSVGAKGIELGVEVGPVPGEDELFGLSKDDIDEIADRIPRGTAAAFILVEHQWAIGLEEAVRNADGTVIAQGWITPATLVAMGEEMAEEAEFEVGVE